MFISPQSSTKAVESSETKNYFVNILAAYSLERVGSLHFRHVRFFKDFQRVSLTNASEIIYHLGLGLGHGFSDLMSAFAI